MVSLCMISVTANRVTAPKECAVNPAGEYKTKYDMNMISIQTGASRES